ncbi:MAG: LysE family transporter [Comamonadaceae bacterium]
MLFCALSDAALIMAGIGGALFQAGYGALAARRAWRGGQMQVQSDIGTTRVMALATCFGFTFLNPHVYLDTVVLLGSIANQRPDSGRWTFGWGAWRVARARQ